MESRGWVAVGVVALLLAGCDQTAEPAAVTVTHTQTVVVERDEQEPEREQIVDDQTCEAMIAMRDANKRLSQDGYADDYSAEHDQQLRAMGCIP